jgi:energy-coupling factor transport system permease protein
VDEARNRGALAFETCHPVVPAVYFAGVIGIGIFTLQPVFAAISVVGALCFAVCCTGWRRALAQLRWQLPMVALVCLANPLFSQSGLTVLATLGPVTVRLEALAYGLCMGASLVCMLQWVANAAHVLTEDRLLELSGTRLPVVTTMVSMAIQLVPQLRRRFGVVESARGACTSAQAPRKGGRVHASTVLMAWAMEDSLERADSMRARGWELGGRRTGYRLEPLRGSDVAAAVAVGLLAFAAALAAYVAQVEWSFYPTMPVLRPWWGYVPFALLALLPTALTLVLRLKEGRLGSVENR